MIDKVLKENCCGCQACLNKCPVNCISMEMDEEGFWYPKINKQICIECEQCEAVCPFIEKSKVSQSIELDLYGAWCTDEEIRFSSSSGGLYTVFAEWIINQGGIVFGAKIDDKGDIVHSCTTNKAGLRAFQKSKYVQSNMGHAYEETRKYLEQGKYVLFSGTPCQIMALNNYLGKKYDRLYTIDVICVGVSSPGVWKAYVKQLEEENGSEIKRVIFRHKEIGGDVLKGGERNLTMKIEFKNGQVLYQYHDKNKFFDGFLNKLYLRPSCAQCKAKNFQSGSDIQLGDFWEIENMYPEVLCVAENGKKIPFGISEVFIYTDKGKKLFDSVKERIHWFEADRFLVENVQADTNWFLLKSSSQQHWNRKIFFEEYNRDSEYIYEIIEKNLNVRNVENLSGIKVGMWGSYNLRNSIGIISDRVDCELKFQFRNSTIYSIMSEKNSKIKNLKLSTNPFRNQMLQYDLDKEFRIHIEKYANSVDFFFIDLLEDRYDNLICGETVITKSEAYFESNGIQGMPVKVSFEMWKSAIERFMQLILKYFSFSQIIVIENYLCHKYGYFNAPKYDYERKEYIHLTNQELAKRYSYIRKKWPQIEVITQIPEDLDYTEKGHRYGCIPEHLSYAGCIWLAQMIGEKVGKMRKE